MKTILTPVEEARMISTEDDITVSPPQTIPIKEESMKVKEPG